MLTRSRRRWAWRVRFATEARAEADTPHTQLARAAQGGNALGHLVRPGAWSDAIALLACVAALWSGCAESTQGSEIAAPDAGDAAAADGRVHVRFAPLEGKLPFGAVPWPDDLYLRDGHVELSALPESSTPTDYLRVMHGSLSELDGFGIGSPIYFFLDGDIDEDTLPHTAIESEGSRAGVFLIDADTASPDAFQRVRVELQWSSEQKRLALRPALGHPLTPGRRYAAILTTKVKDSQGRALLPSREFAAVRDVASTLAEPVLLRARANYAPVLETLAKAGMPRDEVVAMAVFRVQTAFMDLDDARKLVRARDVPTTSNVEILVGSKLDERFGDADAHAAAAPHDNLGAVIHGILPSPNLLSVTAKTHGAWNRDETGALQLKRGGEEVPFTLFLPKGSDPSPVVIYQHALGRERSDAVYVANALARRNIAVIAIDAPFQGLRARSGEGGSVDSINRFTGIAEPDNFGDEPGDFYGEDDKQALLFPFHPFYIRDALRQGVVDLMNVVRFLETDELGRLVGQVQSKRTLDVRRLGFVGEDVGATMGLMLASFEPKLQALSLVGASAFVAQGFWMAASEQPLFETLATMRLGRSLVDVDYDDDSPDFWPEMALFETLLGRGEPLAYASLLRGLPVNVLLMMARDDEVVANLATEALAVSLDVDFLNGEPRYVGDLKTLSVEPSQLASDNVKIEDGTVTRLLRLYEPADHSLLRSKRGKSEYQSPVRPPFVSRDEAQFFTNQQEAALSDLADYFASFFECVAEVNVSTSAVPCSAKIPAP